MSSDVSLSSPSETVFPAVVVRSRGLGASLEYRTIKCIAWPRPDQSLFLSFGADRNTGMKTSNSEKSSSQPLIYILSALEESTVECFDGCIIPTQGVSLYSHTRLEASLESVCQ